MSKSKPTHTESHAELDADAESPQRWTAKHKKECTWQHRFDNLTAAKAVIARCIEHYNTLRTHSALKYNTPRHTYLTLCNHPLQQAA